MNFGFNFGLSAGKAISRILDYIFYQDALKNFVYNTDASGNVILANKGSGEDGLLNTGRGVQLGATNDLPIPIANTGGEDVFSLISSFSSPITISPITNGYNIVHDGTANPNSIIFNLSPSLSVGDVTLTSFNCLINSGIATDILTGKDLIDGINELEKTLLSHDNRVYLSFTDGVAFNIDLTFNSVKQITNPNSFLTIVHGDGSVEQIGNSVDGGSSEEETINGDFEDSNTAWTNVAPEDVVDGQLITPVSIMYQWDLMIDFPATAEIIVEIDIAAFGESGGLRSYDPEAGIYKVIPQTVGIYTYTYTNTDLYAHYVLRGYSNVDGWIVNSVSVKKILPTSATYTFNNQTILEVSPTTSPFTTADLALIEADTTLLARLALGEDNAGGLSLVTADVYGWYSLTENEGGYCIDAKAGYGASNEDATSWLPQISGVGNTITSTGAIGEYDLVSTIATDQPYHPRILAYNSNYIAGDLYLMKTTITVNSGAVFFTTLEVSNGIGLNINETLTPGTYIYYHIANVWDNFVSVGFNGQTEITYNIKARLELFKISAKKVTNYTASIRENVNQNQKGLQTTCLVLDGIGVPTAVDFTKLHWYGVGYNDTQFNPSLHSEFIIEENVGTVFYSHIYDGVNLTTWTDGVEGIPTAHSPENADYLLGKGVYPKVTIDPYMEYIQNWFKTIIDETQILNYNELQAYEDWTISTYGLTDENGNYLTDEDGNYLLQDF